MNSFIYIPFIALLVNGITVSEAKSIEPSIDWCIDTKHHKKTPTKEDSLHNECKPWKDYSCCSAETTRTAHGDTNHYKFNLNHCPERPMSQKCKRHFVRDLCFYECEPYVKPWVKKVDRKIGKERIFGVPICQQDCHQWWDDCKDDYTCSHNWARNFDWTSGTNKCRNECKPLHQYFNSAKEFCENVWDGSWAYPNSSSDPCMSVWFDRKNGNPNKNTALYYYNNYHIIEMIGRSQPNASNNLKQFSNSLYFLVIAFALFLYN